MAEHSVATMAFVKQTACVGEWLDGHNSQHTRDLDGTNRGDWNESSLCRCCEQHGGGEKALHFAMFS